MGQTPATLAALFPASGTLAESLVELTGLFYKPTIEEATWLCPDCGKPVTPRKVQTFENNHWVNTNTYHQHPKTKWFLPAARCECFEGQIRWAEVMSGYAVPLIGPEVVTVYPRRDMLLKSGIAEFDNWTFATWQANTLGRKKLLEKAEKLVGLIANKPPVWASIVGDYSTGKTHMAYAVARSLILDFGVETRVVNWIDHLEAVKATWDQKGISDDGLWKPILEAPVVILDDLDKRWPINPKGGDKSKVAWEFQVLYRLTDVRYVNRRSLIITGNRTWVDMAEAIKSLGDTSGHAIVSRFERQSAPTLSTWDYRVEPWKEKPNF